MADVSPIQTKDNSTLYATTAATGAGAALGGIGGYMRKPFLQEGGKLSDEFIKLAEENLSDDAKKVMVNKSSVLAGENEVREFIEELKNTNLSDANVMKKIQEDAKARIEALQSLPEKIQKAKSFNGFLNELVQSNEDIGKFYAQVVTEDMLEAFNEFKTEIKQKHGYNWSTDLLHCSEIAQTPDELIAVVKPYDTEIAEKIAKTFDHDELLKAMQADGNLTAEIATEIKSMQKIAEAKSFEELKTVMNNLPKDGMTRELLEIGGDIETVNMTKEARNNFIKELCMDKFKPGESTIIEQIQTAKDNKELAQVLENSVNTRVASEKQNLISGCWDATKKEFINTDNALGESVKKTARGMRTRLALMYGAIGAAILGIGTYLVMNSKKTPSEAPNKVDTKA